MDIDNKRVIVTGGASGIGASAVRAFVAAGARIASLDINDAAGQAVVDVAGKSGSRNARYYHCDVANRSSVEDAFARAVDGLGGLDALVHVAGFELTDPAETITDEHWERMMEVNARGTFITNQIAFRYLKDRGGSILNFGSAAGVMGMPGGAAYSASKGAVLGWTRTVAKEWARFGITVNAVAPGMATPMYETHRAKFTPEEAAEHDRMIAMLIPLGGKFGQPDRDLAPFLVFMVSDGARFITGQTLAVDGGLLIP
jgi:NAD(P)-dependent dehydrogenase (short-subunit alcohol dehydrogenase family)